MSEISLILPAVTIFSVIILVLVLIILLAKSRLVEAGNVVININDDPDHRLIIPRGNKLLNALSENNIFIPSACGGGGTCAQCKIMVLSGGGDVLPVEKSALTRRQIRDNYRLSCQIPVKQNMELKIPSEVFESRKCCCRVRSCRNVASFIKELVLELPEGEEFGFRSGDYVQLEAPPHNVMFKDFIIEDDYRPDWDKYNLWRFRSFTETPVYRAYSIVNYPEEKDIITLNVRIATPPPDDPEVPPGKMSSYLFALKPGDEINISGPFGDFCAQDSDSEMIFVGGGAGMAPLRSIIFDQLKRIRTERKISYWYGARSLREAFYIDDFNKLADEYENFSFHVALSRPRPEENWKGYKGYVQHCLHDLYLKDHPYPEECEYYLCGPPMLVASVVKMLDDLGVEPENIFYDDFGE